jgi:hypothetical protein
VILSLKKTKRIKNWKLKILLVESSVCLSMYVSYLSFSSYDFHSCENCGPLTRCKPNVNQRMTMHQKVNVLNYLKYMPKKGSFGKEIQV